MLFRKRRKSLKIGAQPSCGYPNYSRTMEMFSRQFVRAYRILAHTHQLAPGLRQLVPCLGLAIRDVEAFKEPIGRAITILENKELTEESAIREALEVLVSINDVLRSYSLGAA